jgi:carbon monoxide dehydrogenase subunit G
MLMDNGFDVDAPPADVYALMLDPARVAPCIPGAEVVGRRDDGGFDARVTVKVGPVKMSYAGVVLIVEHDDQLRTAAMRARGAEARGQGNVDATMRMAVAERAGGGSHVDVTTEMQVTGRVAQMGQGIMQDVAARMIGEMARNMEALLMPAGPADGADVSPPDAAPVSEPTPIKGLSLLVGVLAGRIRRLFGRSR